jgi:hypothetical protein
MMLFGHDELLYSCWLRLRLQGDKGVQLVDIAYQTRRSPNVRLDRPCGSPM